MRYFNICDLVKHKEVQENWHPGQESIGAYSSKHHDTQNHKQVRPICLHGHKSPRTLPRATKPSVMVGCVGTIPGGYLRGHPLPINGGTMTQVPLIIIYIAPTK